MGARSEALARTFEGRVEAAAAVIDRLSDAEWRKVTGAEKWTVGVTAHHLASAIGPVAGMVSALAAGQPGPPDLTTKMLDQMNAAHAQDGDRYTRAETAALLKQSGAQAAAVIRGLSDEQLARSGTVFGDAPPMTAEQLITLGLIDHVEQHVGSIRRTIGQ